MPESATDPRAVPVPAEAVIGRPPTQTMNGALVDSRERWRALVHLAADFAFETDASGRFVFIAPDPALLWPSGLLVGQPAELILSETRDEAGLACGFNPFRPSYAVRDRRAWLRRGDGTLVCLAFATAPVLDAAGGVIGARGIAHDVTEQDRRDAAVASALRRGELMDHILTQMRQEVLAPRMMQAILTTLIAALGAEGAAVVDMLGDGANATLLHQAGSSLQDVLHPALMLLEGSGLSRQDVTAPHTAQSRAQDGRLILVCPSITRFGEQAGLILWRLPGGRAWDNDDCQLVAGAAAIVRVVLDHEGIQREMARQARTDPLTGLLNRRAFLDEVTRRIDRLERENAPGTLMFVDLDHFKTLNDRHGHDAGDDALCLIANLLRATVRPSDIVARFGGDEFAIWLDGFDEFTAAERAETLRAQTPATVAHLVDPTDPVPTMSIGIATRWPGRGEDIDALITRADHAMYDVKRAGRGHWRVSQFEAL